MPTPKADKFTLYNAGNMHPVAGGMVERIGQAGTAVHYRNSKGKKIHRDAEVNDIHHGVVLISVLLNDSNSGVITSDQEISAVGHRVVHGGEKMKTSVLINASFTAEIRFCSDLAPSHKPPNLEGIEASAARFQGIPPVAVFDTAFHSSLPEKAYLYALP